MLDKIIKGYLMDFKQDHSITSLDDSKAFEMFVNYTVLSRFTPISADLESMDTGQGDDYHMDGVAILVNGSLITTGSELTGLLKNRSNISVDFIFTQAKTGPKLDMGELLKFGHGVRAFFSQDTQKPMTEQIARLIDVKDAVYDESIKFLNSPECHLFFAYTGDLYEDPNIENARQEIEKDLVETNLFSRVGLQLVDRDRLKVYYRELKNKSVKEIEIGQYCDIPPIKFVRESLLGVASAKAFVNLIKDEDGKLSRGIFFENVRDFQGMNNVNQEIYNTLKDVKLSDRFCILNNGVTIVARELLKRGKVFRLTDFQIVNGCQTSNILFNSKELLSDDVFLPVRIIVTDDVDLVSEIVYANNRQTVVVQEAFNSLTTFHKNLEEYYRACRGPQGKAVLYYERRSKQYSGQEVKPVDIVTPSLQIKSFIAVFLEEPHNCDEY